MHIFYIINQVVWVLDAEGHGILDIINWEVRALNADWLTAVVSQNDYYMFDKTCIFTDFSADYIGNRFIKAIGFVMYGQYTTAKPVSRHTALHSA